MPDTAKASWITDHAFEPRVLGPVLQGAGFLDRLPPNPYLCGYQIEPNLVQCRMAEAAHAETTVKR